MNNNIFCSPKSGKSEESESARTVLECDYDDGATNLYQAIEGQAWVPVLQFLKTGRWDTNFVSQKDPHSPARQAKTWVTRFEKDGSVRWSLLSLHLAILKQAPSRVVSMLIALHPEGVRSTDDQQMLPLHLAFRVGSEDDIVLLLLESFPDALFIKDARSRVPTDIDGPRKDRAKILRSIVKATTSNANSKQKDSYNIEFGNLKQQLNLQTKINRNLVREKMAVEEHLARLKGEIILLKNEQAMLQDQPTHIRYDVTENNSDTFTPDISRVCSNALENMYDSVPKPHLTPAAQSQQVERLRSADKSTATKTMYNSESRSDKDSIRRFQGSQSTDSSRLSTKSGRISSIKRENEAKDLSSLSNRHGSHNGIIAKQSSWTQSIKQTPTPDRETPTRRETPARRTHGFFQGFGGTCK